MDVDLVPAAIAVLGVGVLIGVFLLLLVLRNRVYTVNMTRYINKHRQFFLQAKPLGFETTRIYMDPAKPPFFSWASSHTWASNMIATLNALLAATFVFLSLSSSQFLWSMVTFLVFLVIQVVLAILYLRTRENKSASQTLWGST